MTTKATFASLSATRLPKATKAISLLGNLVRYDHTEEEAKALVNDLSDAVDDIDAAFAKKWGWQDKPEAHPMYVVSVDEEPRLATPLDEFGLSTHGIADAEVEGTISEQMRQITRFDEAVGLLDATDALISELQSENDEADELLFEMWPDDCIAWQAAVDYAAALARPTRDAVEKLTDRSGSSEKADRAADAHRARVAAGGSPLDSPTRGIADGGSTFEDEIRWAIDCVKRKDWKTAEARLKRILKGA